MRQLGVNVSEAFTNAYNKLKNKARLQEALNDATLLTDDAGKPILDENGNYLAEVIVDGEKIPVLIGEEEALKKIDDAATELGEQTIKTIDNIVANIRKNYIKWGLSSVEEVDDIINTLRKNLPDDTDNILSSLDNLIDNGSTFGNIKQTINEIAKYKQFGDGSKWTLKYLTNNIEAFKGKNIVFEKSEEIFDEVLNKQMRYLDAKIANGGQGKDIFYEFKSVIKVPPGKFTSQFIKDLSHQDVTDLRQLKWIFDGGKNPEKFIENMKNAIMDLPDDKLKTLANKFIKDIDKPTASDLKKLLIKQQDNIFKLL